VKNLTAAAYFLMIIGGGLTIATGFVVLLSQVTNNYYFRLVPSLSGTADWVYGSSLSFLSGLAVLYLGQRFVHDHDNESRSALLIVPVALIGVYALLISNVFLYDSIFFSGPPISFAGGIAGALFNRVDPSAN
jgi:hypothetical protein